MKNTLFIGVDVGGTKLSAGLVNSRGTILAREKVATPKNTNPRQILKGIWQLIEKILEKKNLRARALSGIGIGIPGIVDPLKGRILVTPNIALAGFDIRREIAKHFHRSVAIGNDVNLGVLGEQWCGAAKGFHDIVGIFPGTGIGGGVIINGKLLIGLHGAAAELGHMILDIHGPLCSCGNYGCLEAIASRWAIERDIRAAVKKGRKTMITEFTDGKLTAIRSKALAKALKRRDPLVTEIMKRTAHILGVACISVRHIFDPQIIILGGGVMEACGDFLLPLIQRVTDANPFLSGFSRCRIVQSQLGDDAVILGAVALFRK